MTMRLAILLVSLCMLLAACREPATAVMVIVTADPGVQGDTRRVRYLVAGGSSPSSLGAPQESSTFTPGPGSWPIVIPIVPQDNDATRSFGVEIIAVGDAGDIVVARGATGFVRGETRALYIHLSDACRVATAPTCGLSQTCVAGACEDAYTPPNALPPYRPNVDAGPPPGEDAGMDGGGLPTCGNGTVDDGEACDDGNDVPGDGCEPGTCRLSCTDVVECNDSNDCTDDDCVPTGGGQACVHDAWIDGTSCVTSAGLDGMCADGQCISQGCGDGTWSFGELCYDEAGLFTDVVPLGDALPTIAAGDFDADTRPDFLLGGDPTDPAASFWGVRNLGPVGPAVSFEPSFSVSPGPRFFGAADPDRDGRASMFAVDFQCNNCFSQMDVDFPIGGLMLRGQEFFEGPIVSVGRGDLDGDGREDVAVAFFSPVFPPSMIGVQFLLTDATGGFIATGTTPLPGSTDPPLRMVAGVAQPGLPPSLWVYRRDGQLERYESFGDGIGTLLMTNSFPVDTSRPVSLMLATVDPSTGSRLLLLTANDPARGAALITRIIDPESLTVIYEHDWGLGAANARFLGVADVDNDGDNDGVLVTDNLVRFMIIQGGLPSGTHEVPLPCAATSADLADFNGDAAPDIAIAADCGVLLLLARP